MRLASLLIAAAPLLSAVQALHFYFDTPEKRCFLEELPSDTQVEGHYRALWYDHNAKTWKHRDDMGIHIEVTDLSNGAIVVNKQGSHSGRFTFTSNDAADHNICLSSTLPGENGIKMYLDLTVGSPEKASQKSSQDKEHADTMATKLRDLYRKVESIQREQRYMREVEATFRNASETINSRAWKYILIQIGVLVAAAVWQTRHLKVYFDDKKLR